MRSYTSFTSSVLIRLQNSLPQGASASVKNSPALRYSPGLPVWRTSRPRRRSRYVKSPLSLSFSSSSVNLLEVRTMNSRSTGPSSRSSPVSESMGARTEEFRQSKSRCARIVPSPEMSSYGKMKPRNTGSRRQIAGAGILEILVDSKRCPSLTRPYGSEPSRVMRLSRSWNSGLKIVLTWNTHDT